jgi:hypothetical protein
MNIEAAFKEFLIEKQQILNTEQQKDYTEVIDLFIQFINSFSYLGLDTEEADLETFNLRIFLLEKQF